ncbi:MAG TPA: hypothetical protein VF573_00035, partial [Paraburkholderia sp.]
PDAWPAAPGAPVVAFGTSGASGTSGETSVPAAPSRSSGAPSLARAAFGRRPKVELLWDSPAAAGHNRQTVFSTPLTTEGDRVAARALDTTLKQV